MSVVLLDDVYIVNLVKIYIIYFLSVCWLFIAASRDCSAVLVSTSVSSNINLLPCH